MKTVDVLIIIQGVHGGNIHKLCHFHDLLHKSNLTSCLIFSSEPPLGIQREVDIDDKTMAALETRGIFIKRLAELPQAIQEYKPKLLLFDSFEFESTHGFVEQSRNQGAKTGQLSFLFDDFGYHGTDFVFLQHPFTLFYAREVRQRKDAQELTKAKQIFFCGNIAFEPLCNTWTTDVRSRHDFFAKYKLHEDLPLAVWLPDRTDGISQTYKQVIDAAKALPVNLVVKLHPWEYKNRSFRFDTFFGEKRTSAEHWNISAIEEKDASWAYEFCDVAIARTSLVGLEMTWWKKPMLYIDNPSLNTRRLAKHFTCARWIPANNLKNTLAHLNTLRFTDEEYARKKNLVFPQGSSKDSFELHIYQIMNIINNPDRFKNTLSDADIQGLYAGQTLPKLSLADYGNIEIIKGITSKLLSHKN